MRILVCASEAPLEPLNGLRLQIRALTTTLARRHDVHVLAYRWPDQDGSAPAGVRLETIPGPAATTSVRLGGWLRAVGDWRPIEAVKLTGTMAAAVERLRARETFDVAHVTSGELAAVRPALGRLPAVLAPLDAWERNVAAEAAVAHGPRRLVLAEQTRRVRRFVRSAYRAYDHIVLVSDEDARATLETAPGLPVTAISNGVDLDAYAPARVSRAMPPREASPRGGGTPPREASPRGGGTPPREASPGGGATPEPEPEPGLIVFTGAMQFAPNVLAARLLVRDVLPRVRRRHPSARVAIVGRSPAPEVRALAGDGVEVTGEVPDVRPWLWRASVFACPMTAGTGVKNKLLEALACGAPCVVTPLAHQGIALRDGEHALVASGANALAEAIARVLTDPPLARSLAAAGRAFVEQEHGWDAVAQAYERLYDSATARTRMAGEGA